MFAQEIRRQAEEAPRAALPAVTAALWRAFAEGQVSEAEAEALSALIDARQEGSRDRRIPSSTEAVRAPAGHSGSPRTSIGSRPRTDASMERRRRWAASGRLPPALSARFTLAEQAVLSLIAAEVARRKDCRMAVEHMAAIAGVSRSTVKTALREAKRHGLITVEERKVSGWRNDTNVVRVVSPEWVAWLRLARQPSPVGGGVKFPTTTPTHVSNRGKTRIATPQKKRMAGLESLKRESSRATNA